jgi:MraZ protein
MEPLVGSYELKLDAKLRLSLPLPLRRAMGVQTDDEIMLTIGADGCVAGVDLGGWAERYLPRLQQLSWTRAEDRALLRDMAPRTFKVRIDTENRITMPSPLLQWGGMKAGSTVHVQGLVGHFEIWETSRLEARDHDGTSFEERLEHRLGVQPETNPVP